MQLQKAISAEMFTYKKVVHRYSYYMNLGKWMLHKVILMVHVNIFLLVLIAMRLMVELMWPPDTEVIPLISCCSQDLWNLKPFCVISN